MLKLRHRTKMLKPLARSRSLLLLVLIGGVSTDGFERRRVVMLPGGSRREGFRIEWVEWLG